MPKYYSNKKTINKTTPYEILLNERGLKFADLFTSGIQMKIDYSSISYRKHVWSKGDNLFRLSNKYYGGKENWWIIAAFNQKPTDAHFNFGDVVLVPTNPNAVAGAILNYG